MNEDLSGNVKGLQPLRLIYKLALLAAFFIFSLVLFYLSFSEIVNFMLQMKYEESVLVYARGSILGLGAGVGLLSFTLLACVNVFFGDRLASKFFSVLKYVFIVVFILILLVPFFVDSNVRNYALENSYISCESAKSSGSWPMFETTYYTVSVARCESFTKEIQKERDEAFQNLFN